jgi:hypothetical protein
VKPRILIACALLLTLVSCATTPAAEKPAAEAGASPAGKDEAKADAIKKKERELNYSKLQLHLTELEMEADARGQKNAIADAERAVRKAEEDLSDYLQTLKTIEDKERALGVDQQKEGLRETQQEYDELESMYKGEDFAGKTKELVLSRGKARLDFSKRGMDLTGERHRFQDEKQTPRKERDLRDALDHARTALEDTRSGAERKKLSNELQMLKAKDALDDQQQELEKLKKPAA